MDSGTRIGLTIKSATVTCGRVAASRAKACLTWTTPRMSSVGVRPHVSV
jgi:hypothetical protein